MQAKVVSQVYEIFPNCRYVRKERETAPDWQCQHIDPAEQHAIGSTSASMHSERGDHPFVVTSTCQFELNRINKSG